MRSLPKTSSSENSYHSKQADTQNKAKKNLPQKKTKTKRHTHPHQKPQSQNYRWMPHQHHRYVNFLEENIHLFSLSYKQKIKVKIHKLMSDVVKLRNPYQCRSHHQKMLLRHRSIQNIIRDHYEQIRLQGLVKLEQVMDKQQLHFKAEDRKNEGRECKIQQFENSYIQPQINKMQYAAEFVIKEEQEVVYRTFK